MEKPTIVLKLKVKQFSAIRDLALRVHDHLSANVHFVSPSPSLTVLQSGIDQLTEAIARWGTKGNRGSHYDHVVLEGAALDMYNTLKSLACYCENTVMLNVPPGEQEGAMASSGFGLKKQKTPQGRLEMVQNFQQFFARNLRQGEVKMRWEIPLNVSTHTNVRSYDVFRNVVNDFATAKCIKSATVTTHRDTPGSGTWFYWVVPINCVGYGVTSHAVLIRVV